MNPLRLSRREALKLSLATTLAGSVPWFEPLRAHAAQSAASGRTPPKQCILLWLGGGPSQAHSFDPKPGEHVGLLQTNVPGLHFSEYLPRLASGELTAAVAISEPNAGAHPKRLASTARREGDFWVLNCDCAGIRPPPERGPEDAYLHLNLQGYQ